jgi:dihydroflavonol-4-reductase
MKVVVTGARSHLGANLVRALLERGQKVRAVSEPADGPSLRRIGVEEAHADLHDLDTTTRALLGADVVFHIAEDAVSTRHVVEACLRNGALRLVCIGPDGGDAVRDGIARGLETVTVIPTNMVGPWDFQPSLIGQILLSIWNERLQAVVEAGMNWVDVRDVATAAVQAATRGRVGGRYIIGGTWMSMPRLAQLAANIGGVRAPEGVLPYQPAFGLEGELVVDDAATEELGHRPRPIEVTIADTHSCFMEHGMLRSSARSPWSEYEMAG